MVSIPATDLVDYIFKFPDVGAALRDPIVGPSFITPSLPGFFRNKEVLVFKNTTIDSVDYEQGFWFILTELGLDSSLTAHPNIQIVNDLTLMFAGKPSVIQSNFDTTFTNIIINNLQVYCLGLLPITVVIISFDILTEDGSPILTESGLNIVTEAATS